MAVDRVKALADSRPLFFDMRPAQAERATPVGDGVHMSAGCSNAYAVATGAGRVIINTGMGWEAPVHRRAFDAVCPGPTSHILLTQGHVDHVGGVRLFREPATEVIAQRDNAACQADDARIAAARLRLSAVWFSGALSRAAELARQDPSLFAQDAPVPDRTFDDRHSFEAGGVRFEIHATPGGETTDSCVVWLPERRMCFSGNTFGPLFPHFPNFNTLRGDKYRFAEPYLAAVRRVRSLAPDVLVTGHFEPIVGAELIDECLSRLHDAVDYVHRETLRGINAGEDILELMRAVRLPDSLYVGQGYGKVSWAVRTFWESYIGWFRQRSSAELYPVAPQEACRDLIELAGRDATLRLARERLAERRWVHALHLAEMLMDLEPGDAQARDAALAAQRGLLEDSGGDNFWETGWLRAEIARLERG